VNPGIRIFVTGNAGSGKSTRARKIASDRGLPFHGLDHIVWRPGWRKTSTDERDRLIRQLTAGQCWVIDGVSRVAQAEADVVVFLDVPRRISFWRVAKRNWRYLFRSRPGLPPACPEILILPTLCRIIWNFPDLVRPGIVERGREASGTKHFFHVKSKDDLAEALTALNRI
jgi:adenylate kinase family enzyme